MLTLEKWLNINQCEFAVDTYKKLADLKPITWNALLKENGSVKIFYETANRANIFEIDIYPDKTFEWFWRDRLTNDSDGTDDIREAEFSDAFKERLGNLDA